MMNKLSRRHFVKVGALGAASLALLGQDTLHAASDLRRYEPNLRDRLWMWGHGPGTTNGVANIPTGNNIDMADAIEYMGIPNICVIRWEGKPEPPFDEYIKQFRKTKRVAWSIVDGATQSYAQKKRWAFELCEKMPNLVCFYLDDYFHYVKDDIPAEGQEMSVEILTLNTMRDLRREVNTLKKPTDLAMVVYSDQLRELQPEIKPHIDCCDVVSFWTWNADNLTALEENFKKYRKIVPDKPTLLGTYMWDFGGAKPITQELMKLQLEFALRKFKEKQIDGMIFHCTPLCDLGLEAVEYSKKWIAEYGDLIQ